MVFDTENELYDAVGDVLRTVGASPGFYSVLSALKGRIEFRVHEPDALLSIDCSDEGPFSVGLGQDSKRGSTVIVLSGDELHRLFIGESSIVAATSTGAIAISGEAKSRFVRITPLLRKVVGPLYAQRLEKLGREELTGPWSPVEGSSPNPNYNIRTAPGIDGPAGTGESDAEERSR